MDEELPRGPVLLEPGKILGAEPRVGGVLDRLQAGAVQVSVDVGETVGLVAHPAVVVSGPGGDAEQLPYPP
ncbi:hypothetical protein [Streptomyces violascens]|uniref:Uncharacterized protein n=1 Tax=Streptomyces violascens TaxID=67381 RepID=A0ABQ3QS72_9ACTN|nr:hypothetical protein [Streptomyces violascens]GGU48102.1 hypothetical protein GCM10010289_80840 [Streptomyces violascens]GHI40135.1 hypothetical protein Sviol_45430 [Streptomyces violascens]